MNAIEHAIGAAGTVGGISAYTEYQKTGEISMYPLLHASVAAVATKLPDLLEPAYHPNHRKFFHSVTFASALGFGLYRLHKWQAETEKQKLLKTLGFVVGGAYLIHLAMDATTPKSLPLI